MSYKTILLHLNHDERAPQVLAAGVQLARAFDAHLIGLHVFPAYRLLPPIPIPLGRDVLGGIKARINEDVARIKGEFEEATKGQPFVSEWRQILSDRRDPAEIVLDHGRAADLIITSQADPNWEMSPILDFPERLALDSGRPVLVTPIQGAMRQVPTSITVAWKARREAARAVADAMPLLKRAASVNVLTVKEEVTREGSLPDTELAAALARHGVNVAMTPFSPNGSVGEDIARVASEQSELLVMGAYGHSRLREFVLGGVTHHMLKAMTIPVLFSH